MEEPGSEVLVGELDERRPELVACFLLETELRRLVNRRAKLTHAAVTDVLDRILLYDVPSTLFRESGLLSGGSLRSLDALRLAATPSHLGHHLHEGAGGRAGIEVAPREVLGATGAVGDRDDGQGRVLGNHPSR